MNNRWYSQGLRFSCRQCGSCCTGAPGYVWLSREDIGAMAEALGIDCRAFLQKYCRRVQGRISLLEYENGDCVFYNSPGCALYSARPAQCRAFPFWPQLLKSRGRWEREKRRCPGMGEGETHSPGQIEEFKAMVRGS